MGASPLFLAPLNGSLAYRDRAGVGTLTGVGAIRYQAAAGARVNLMRNPNGDTNTTNWTASGVTLTSSSEYDMARGKSLKSVLSAVGVASGFYSTVTGATMMRVTPGVNYVFSAYVYHALSGPRSVRLGIIYRDLNGGAKGSISTGYTTVQPNTPTRLSQTLVAPAGAEAAYVVVYFDNSGTYPFSNGDVIYTGKMQFETGTTPTEWFDGASGGIWLDQILNVLGTAYDSASVSSACALVEEGTTNTVPDPSFASANITDFWAVAGVSTIAKQTNYALFGSTAARVTCTASASDGIDQLTTSGAAAATAQNWTASAWIRAWSATDVGKTVKLAIYERDAANAIVATGLSSAFTLTDAWQFVSFTRVLAGGGTVAKITLGLINGAATAVDFVADGVQLENKAYVTTTAIGAMATGYTWSGTTNGSSSVRANTTITVDEVGRVNALKGAAALRYRSFVSSQTHYMLMFGESTASKDQYILFQSGGNALWMRHLKAGVANVTAQDGSVSVSTDQVAFGSWDNGVVTASVDNGAVTSNSGAAAHGDISGGQSLQIGNTNTTSVNGRIGPVMTFDKQLTAAEKAKMVAAPVWSWGMLSSSLASLRVGVPTPGLLKVGHL